MRKGMFGYFTSLYYYCVLMAIIRVIIPIGVRVLAEDMVRTLKGVTRDTIEYENLTKD